MEFLNKESTAEKYLFFLGGGGGEWRGEGGGDPGGRVSEC